MKIKNTVKFIDWFLYIILSVVAIYVIIASDVIQKYLKKQTDTYQNEIVAEDFSVPEFRFCDVPNSGLGLVNQYEVEYWINDLALGTERKRVEDFTKYILHNGECFVLIPPDVLNLTYNFQHDIIIRFNTSIPIEDLPQITGSITSRNNPWLYGIHHDGSVMLNTINAGEWAYFRINEERMKYLPENCRSQPILDYLVTEFGTAKINCSLKCFPKSLNLGDYFEERMKMYPICDDQDTSQCVEKWVKKLLKNSKSYCKKISYAGEVITFKIESGCSKELNKCSHMYKFDFTFENLGKVIVHTEYFLYDFISTLGNVGGTLGLFIGISFSGVISCILSTFVSTCQYFEIRFGNKINLGNINMSEENSDHRIQTCHPKLDYHTFSIESKIVTQDMMHEFEDKMKEKEDEIITKLKGIMVELSELKRIVHLK